MTKTFAVLPLRLYCGAGTNLEANYLRGRFGKALRDMDRAAYEKWFAPRTMEGPSGLRDAPRPFVLRVRDGYLGINLFDLSAPVDLIARSFAAERVDGEPMHLSLEKTRKLAKVRMKFLTPTELKGAERPDFGVLFARIRDRVSTLKALYQGGALQVDFKAMGERAGRVRMSRCEIEHVAAERTSRATGQTHPLGGFVGVAEYEGDLGEFFPYLEVARWTGVGRQTVWGKGEIACEEI